MNTYFGLLAEFNGRTELPLEEVAPRFFGISPRTVETHRERVMTKLRIRTVAGLTRLVVEQRLGED